MFPIVGMNIEWIFLIAIAVVGFIVQARLQAVFGKYSKVTFAGGLTGREVAEKMLRESGINSVKVVATRGNLTDNYNPRTRTISLSEGVYASNSVAAAAVAAHETGHAIQHAVGYAPLKMRSALVPVISVTSKWAIWVILAGIMMTQMDGGSMTLYWIGILMIAMSAVFALITLPVELNASARAMHWLRADGSLNPQQLTQARTALNWAARTYLVAALSAVVTLLYFLAARRN
ncbi:MAG: zinc metallopeptidase [Rikenellaceae bacterium]|nr:zinc metallopeptidase [Rikenellaceae bacterium]MCL2691843.1 zinc metallopeptidase [Rikenellaceae bacterium]